METTIKLTKLAPIYLDQVVDIFCRVHGGDFDDTKERFERHATYGGYQGLVAVDENDKVHGFVYGYTSLPGQFYNGKLRAKLTDGQIKEWLTDCFEFVELAVDPDHHRKGIGKQLHDAILESVPHQTSVLTTGVNMEAAKCLYLNNGWEIIQKNVDVLGVGNQQLIMGKKLK
ncbi:GNAT family N-acetyltransferase [Bacillus sp. Marseille-Q3570]|uniref:GNAT family N-acetyltransferase n=1 Tax=Bacillus sp. Marseille-Q3570 TaxID=2963522 RepID=UPI0021B7E02B|nr:GNAT family N-acetyltransferase [Bacillus sp. Marseille-Q3570]